MLTGRHMVRDVSCKYCDTKLGWIYEFAMEEQQRYTDRLLRACSRGKGAGCICVKEVG